MFLLEKLKSHFFDLVGLLPGLEPRCDCMPPALLVGSFPLVMLPFIILTFWFVQKKAQRLATGPVMIVGVNTSYVFDNSLCDG